MASPFPRKGGPKGTPLSDIFREVEEEVRRERLAKFWKAYGDYVIALLAVIILGVAGWQLWLRYEAGQRAKASTAFAAAQAVSNPAQAADMFAKLAKAAPSGYAELSKLSEANAEAASGRADEAVALYKQVAADDSGPVGAVARLRAAWILADNASRADLATLLDPINQPGNAWHEMAQEVLAYSDYKAGKMKAAAGEFGALAADPQTPDALRNRARAFAAFLNNGGAANFGTVPAPEPVPAPGQPAPAKTGAPAKAKAPAKP